MKTKKNTNQSQSLHNIDNRFFSNYSNTKVLERLSKKEPIVKKRINTLIRRIRKKVLKCEPLGLLNYSQLKFLFSLLGINSEFQQLGLTDFSTARSIEYIQSIYVSSQRPKKMLNYKYSKKDPSKKYNRISIEIEKLYLTIHLYYLCLSAKLKKYYDQDETVLELLGAQTDFLVRGERYQYFELMYYQYLLTPHNNEFLKLFNLTSENILNGLQKLQYDLTQGRFDRFNKLHELFDILQNTDENQTEEVLMIQKPKAQELIEDAIGTKLNDVCSITGWNTEFTDELSFGLGEALELFENEQYAGWPIIDLPVHKRPFIKINDKSYCFDYYSLVDNFYRTIQKTITRLDKTYNWALVQQQASEAMTADVFQKLLPGSKLYSNNYYPKESSLKQLCENDLIVLFQEVIIIIEIKAGSFVYTTPLLDFENHIKSYKKLIEEPENQCQRTYNYLTKEKDATFYNENRSEKFRIDTSKYKDIFMISVTIDNINSFASRAEKLSFIKTQSKAISIAIDDLMIYQDYFDSPLVFLHHLKFRRESTTIKSFIPNDELDHLGAYIYFNNYPRYLKETDADKIMPIGLREDLDTYYNQKYHQKLNPSKPVQPIPPLIKGIIAYLDASKKSNKVCIANYFLDFSYDDRVNFNDEVINVYYKQQSTGTVSILSSGCKDNDAIPYTCFVNQPQIKTIPKSQQNDYVWSMMLWNEDNTRALIKLMLDDKQKILAVEVKFYTTNDIPERRKDELFLQGKARAKERIQRYIYKKGDVIHDNEICPCGSGKIYKNCCKQRITF